MFNKNLSYIYILHIYIIHVPFNRIHLVSLNQKIIARSVLVTKKKKGERKLSNSSQIPTFQLKRNRYFQHPKIGNTMNTLFNSPFNPFVSSPISLFKFSFFKQSQYHSHKSNSYYRDKSRGNAW